MNAASATPCRSLHLVEIIDFKWLMAGDGHHVHVEHLQADPAYARHCLQLAAGSRIAALRETAARLAATLGLSLAD